MRLEVCGSLWKAARRTLAVRIGTGIAAIAALTVLAACDPPSQPACATDCNIVYVTGVAK